MKSSTLLAAAAASSFLALGARAEPLVIEPFNTSGYSFVSPSGAYLTSFNDEGYDGKATTGITHVYAPDGSLLYDIPVFSGRRKIFMSPDALIVVFDGNMYHGTEYMRATLYQEGDPTVTEVYLSGVSWKNVTYEADLGGEPLDEDVQWGWAIRPVTLDLDWERRVLAYDVGGVNASEVNLPSLRGRRTEEIRHIEFSLPGLWDIVLVDIPDGATPLTIEPFNASGYSFVSPSGAYLTSTNDEGYDGKAITGNTQVFSPSGVLLYEFPVFSGRRDIYLSPDATIVVFDGNIYFGSEYLRSDVYHGSDPLITTVYQNGQSWKYVMYEGDLGGPPLEEDVPYGWARRNFTLDVNWEHHMLMYDMEEINVGDVNFTKHVNISLPGMWDTVIGDDDDDYQPPPPPILDDDDDYVPQ